MMFNVTKKSLFDRIEKLFFSHTGCEEVLLGTILKRSRASRTQYIFPIKI